MVGWPRLVSCAPCAPKVLCAEGTCPPKDPCCPKKKRSRCTKKDPCAPPAEEPKCCDPPPCPPKPCCKEEDPCPGCGDPCLGCPFPDEVLCDPNMVCRIIQLLSDPCIMTYYVFSAVYTAAYASVSREQPRVVMYSILRVLPLLYLIAYIAYSKAVLCVYAKYICLGLFLTSLAEAAHVFDWDYFMHAVAIYSLAMCTYIAAMYCKYRGTRLSWLNIPLNVLCMLFLHFHVAGYLSPLILFFFGAFTAVMAFFALSRFEKERTAPAYLGAAGALLFQIYCFFYALGTFAPTFVCVVAPEMVMAIFYLAQLGIGLSVHFC